MASEVFPTPSHTTVPQPVALKRPKVEPKEENVPKKRPVLTDFNTFCTWVLEYEASLQQERQGLMRSTSPLDSEGSSTTSISEMDDSLRGRFQHRELEKGEDWYSVTCYCGKPFSGRPMIECNECTTWIHLSCAKIRKSNVPDVFVCQKCRDSKMDIRRSNRQREPKKQFKELYEDE
ncbi:PHD finger protein 13 [Holothuria leucospilota]|uniref:PHD finger protein 13 n=1 Tax=Holothuria leucospilota TaxID=206669 RepID=A0A9Q1HKU1_HOLLE|nr:PHD finger protein 13 [Holothuria leucospilota]